MKKLNFEMIHNVSFDHAIHTNLVVSNPRANRLLFVLITFITLITFGWVCSPSRGSFSENLILLYDWCDIKRLMTNFIITKYCVYGMRSIV